MLQSKLPLLLYNGRNHYNGIIIRGEEELDLSDNGGDCDGDSDSDSGSGGGDGDSDDIFGSGSVTESEEKKEKKKRLATADETASLAGGAKRCKRISAGESSKRGGADASEQEE